MSGFGAKGNPLIPQSTVHKAQLKPIDWTDKTRAQGVGGGADQLGNAGSTGQHGDELLVFVLFSLYNPHWELEKPATWKCQGAWTPADFRLYPRNLKMGS